MTYTNSDILSNQYQFFGCIEIGEVYYTNTSYICTVFYNMAFVMDEPGLYNDKQLAIL